MKKALLLGTVIAVMTIGQASAHGHRHHRHHHGHRHHHY